MWTLGLPTDKQLLAFRLKQSRLAHTYPFVGATLAATRPAGYDLDHNRVRLGDGPDTFRQAVEALRQWKQMPTGWLRIDPAVPKIEVGSTLAVVASALGVWWVNANRIVYVIDEPTRFGYAFGTLPDHAESGEERFLVEMHADGSVWYDVLAYSRPRFWGARLTYPLIRTFQARFARDSLRRMTAAVTHPATLAPA